MEALGLAHECRTEATRIRATDLLQVTVSRDAMAGLLERCATSLEEMDAANRVASHALDHIEEGALSIYREAGRHGEQGKQMDRADMYASLLSDLVVGLCAYLKKEKAIG